jgi:signal transduction histidine kinase
VRHLVELHGGTVEAASGGEGMGATFTVKLPLTAQAVEEKSAAGSVLTHQ